MDMVSFRKLHRTDLYIVIINGIEISLPLTSKEADKLIDDIYEAIGNLSTVEAETRS